MKSLQKRLLTACAVSFGTAAVPAAAQTPAPGSSVNLYGLVDVYAGSIRRSDMPGRVASLNSGGLNTSFWGVKGTEDLGGGLQAIFTLESFFQADTGIIGRTTTDPYFSKNAWVGLNSRYGQLTAGRQTNPLFLATGAFNPFGTSLQLSPVMLQTWSPAYNRNVLGDSVWDNAVQYGSPTMNGFRVTATYGFGEVQSRESIRNVNLTVNYANGPFAAVVSGQQAKAGSGFTTAIGNQRVVMAGISYDFQWVRLFGELYRSRTPDIRSTVDTAQLGLTVPLGMGRVMASIARTEREVGAAETRRNTSALGYNYDLSKRTDLYAIYLRDKLTGFEGRGSVALGVRHRF